MSCCWELWGLHWVWLFVQGYGVWAWGCGVWAGLWGLCSGLWESGLRVVNLCWVTGVWA